MAKFVLNDNASQWCNGNYELIHSSLIQITKIRRKKTYERSRHKRTENLGFLRRFFSRKKEDTQEVDVLSDSDDYETTYNQSDISYANNSNLKHGIIQGMYNLIYHKPHMIPKRDPSLSRDDLVQYLSSKYHSLLGNIDNIDRFSKLANVDQFLCSELLFQGICYFGMNESQKMSEHIIIEKMLYRQSKYQIESLLLLFTFVNSGALIKDNRYNPDIVFPEVIDIFNHLISNGLIKNVCMLLLGAINEATRYRTITSDEQPVSKLLYEHCIDLINDLLLFLAQYFSFFQPTEPDFKCISVLMPHILNLPTMFNLSEFTSSLQLLFEGHKDENVSSWYPQSLKVASLWVGIKEFEDLSNSSCNVSDKLFFIFTILLHPGLYRFKSLVDIQITNELNPKILECLSKSPPCRNYNNINIPLEFVLYGVYRNDIKKNLHYIDIGAFGFLYDHFKDIKGRFKKIVTTTISSIIKLFLFQDDSLNTNWFKILDFEVECRRKSDDLARLVRDDVIDESIYRTPGKSIIELIHLLSHLDLGEMKDVSFMIWKSCAESYRAISTNVQCQVYKFNEFENDLYNLKLESPLDTKTFERLTTPEKGFSWWERNSALLELVSLAADSFNISVEVYPKLFTCILEFASLLSGLDIELAKLVGEFLSSGASRELQFPFLLERIISQVGCLAKGDFSELPHLIYERIIARDDQIETAEAAIQIASSIPSEFSRKFHLDGTCLRRLYTFPLIHSSHEVRVALCSLGLGGNSPFGLMETASAIFKLISNCNRIHLYDDCIYLNIQLSFRGDTTLGFLDAVFSILSQNFIPGSELMLSSLLNSLSSIHISDTKTGIASLEKISELLNNDKCMLGRNVEKAHLTEYELCSLMKALKELFLSIPRSQRFNVSKNDWLYSLVSYSLKVLDSYCLSNKSVNWSIINSVLDFLLEVSKGPIASDKSKATEFLLEQILIPGSTASVSILRAANEAKSLPALSLICVLFKRDVLLILAHRVSLFLSNKTGDTCLACNKLFDKPLKRKNSLEELPVPGFTNPFDWWVYKIQKINKLFSPRSGSQEPEICECLQISMRPVSLLMAHDSMMEALASIRMKDDLNINDRCDLIGTVDSGMSVEIKIKSIFILIQMVERLGIDSLFISESVLNEIRHNFTTIRLSKEHPEYINFFDMESEDLILYNRLSEVITNMNHDLKMENKFFSLAHLNDLNRCGYHDLLYYLLNHSSCKLSKHGLGSNFAELLLGDESNIISLIRFASDDNIWDFADWNRICALHSLVSYVKSMPKVAKLTVKYWPNIEADVHKLNLSALTDETFIIQAHRISLLLQLLTIIYAGENFERPLADMIPFIKLCVKFINISCDTQASLHVKMIHQLKNVFSNDPSFKTNDFVKCWKTCSYPRYTYKSEIALCTRILNPISAESIIENDEFKRYILLSSRVNLITSSCAYLISSLLQFISKSYKYNIRDISTKCRNWLELASVEFNPGERSELKLMLQIALIKKLARVWIKTTEHHDDSLFAVSIVLKLVAFLLTHESSVYLRSKVYSCVNLLLSNKNIQSKTTELFIAHILSQTFDFSNISFHNTRLLQLLFNDASADDAIQYNLNDNSIETLIYVGQDYKNAIADKSLDEILQFEYIRSSEMFHIAIDGAKIDCRVESLSFLSCLLSSLRMFEATFVEYDTGTLSYGSLGILSSKQIGLLIQNRLLSKDKCKECETNQSFCKSCLNLIIGTARVLEAASLLHQFSSFWFHVRPDPEPCLADLFLSCDLLLKFDSSVQDISIICPFMSILENMLNAPSVKTRNTLVHWLNRHSEILTRLLTTELSHEHIKVICCLLRVYRISLLWQLSEYRTVDLKPEFKENFNLVLADLQSKFTLAINIPKTIPKLLDNLTMKIYDAPDNVWQCTLLGLQTCFPELGAFEVDLDLSSQLPIKALAIEKCNTAMLVLRKSGESLLSYVSQLASMDTTLIRNKLGKFALRIVTVECSVVLLEYILSLLLHTSPSSRDTKNVDKIDTNLIPKLKTTINIDEITDILDKIAMICKTNGASNNTIAHGRNHNIRDNIVEYLSPYELEHVPSFNEVQHYSYSYKSLFNVLLSSVCNLAAILEQHYDCKFSSQVLNDRIIMPL